ncbi:helix-turn-helix transcriptional regulator [Nocardia gipuzkoensis]|uniref:helix-turn-helix transcriptional regulator n=1 Tax=Nocardia gipuzkoensis TaxID=2749991 RepID=UPI0015EE5E48|nr:AAA family ATPase [Nocardia gipuzkoensis]
MQECSATVFLGRDAEIERLAVLARRAAAGQGSVVLVEGEPGIGKTSLLEAAGIRFAEAGLHVRIGAAMELQRDVPFAAVRSWLAADDTGPGGPDPSRPLLHSGDRAGDAAATHEFAVTETILDRVDAWCAGAPVALILDDVHWADTSSLSVLRRLCALVDALPLLLVLATRPLPPGQAFAALSAELVERKAPAVRLGALPDSDAAALVRHLVGAAPGAGLLRIVSDAQGNPLHITEVVAALLRAEAIAVIAEIAAPAELDADDPPSASISEAIIQRLELLSRPTRDVLPMAAALGPVLNVGELAAVLDSPLLTVWRAVTEAMDGGLLTRVESELVFRHDLVRDVLADRLPASLRADLLRRAGQVLQATDAPIERVAYYLSACGHDLDTTSLDWLVAVAGKLIVRAPELAVQLLSRAVTAADLDGALRSVLIRWQTRALLWNGRAAEAESVVRSALRARPEHDHDVELTWLLVQVCQSQGRLADAVLVAETALSTMDLRAEDAGRLLGMCGLDNFFLERFEAAEQAGRRAVSIGKSTGIPLATGYGLMALGAVRYTQGYLDEALDLSTRILTIFEDGTGSDQFDPYVLYAHCLIELDRLADAEETLKTAIGHNRRMHGVYLSANLLAKARLYLLDGRWDDALAECAASMEAPDVLGYAPVAQSLAALIGIHRGTFLPGPDGIPVPDDRLGSTGYAQLHPWVKALTHEARGHPERALELLVDTQRRLADGLTASTLHYIFPDIARLAADVGDRDAARSVVAGADELLVRQKTAGRTGTALLCRGLAEADPELLFAAAHAFQQSGWPLYEAQAHENAAVLLAASKREADARSALDTAIGLYGRLGASWDSARAAARVRQHGIRLGVRGRRNRPKTGWAALTDTERKVAALVAEGCSNSDMAAQMFLSRRTIQSHVSSILTKLGLRSRREIAADMPRSVNP